MIIAFSSQQLRDLLSSERMLIERIGPHAAEQAINRLADIRAAACGAELIAGKPRRQPDGRVLITIGPGSTLTVKPNHIDEVRNADWFTVDRVLVESLTGGA